MNKLRMISDYKHDSTLRRSFNQLAGETFGINFEEWYNRGAWDDSYVCYSYAEGDRVVANVSINKMTLLLDGQICPVLQIGTVMTAADYRNKGLSRSLMEAVIADLGKDAAFIYLYANDTVLEFYPRLGFEALPLERRFAKISSPGTGAARKRKLDVDSPEDWRLITGMVQERRPLSSQASVLGADAIFAWYCLNIFREDLYYLEELDAIVIYQDGDDGLQLFDVVCRQPVKLHDVIGALKSGADISVELHFTPDFADADIVSELIENPVDEALFIKASSVKALPASLFLPLTSRA